MQYNTSILCSLTLLKILICRFLLNDFYKNAYGAASRRREVRVWGLPEIKLSNLLGCKVVFFPPAPCSLLPAPCSLLPCLPSDWTFI